MSLSKDVDTLTKYKEREFPFLSLLCIEDVVRPASEKYLALVFTLKDFCWVIWWYIQVWVEENLRIRVLGQFARLSSHTAAFFQPVGLCCQLDPGLYRKRSESATHWCWFYPANRNTFEEVFLFYFYLWWSFFYSLQCWSNSNHTI